MAGNHNKPRRVRKLIRKLKATPLMRAQGVQVVAHPEIREIQQQMLQNGADLDRGSRRAKVLDAKCPDEGRVCIRGEVIEEQEAAHDPLQ